VLTRELSTSANIRLLELGQQHEQLEVRTSIDNLHAKLLIADREVYIFSSISDVQTGLGHIERADAAQL